MFTLRAFVVIAAAIGYVTSPAIAQTNASLDDTYIASPPVWKTISLGAYASSTAMFDALDEASVHIGDLADEVLHRPAFTRSKMKTHVQLVVLSATDLGLSARESLASVYARASRLGYELCPPEVAVQLRLQYRDQPVGEFLDIAMEPIATYEGELVGLSVANGGAGLMLVGQTVSLETVPDRGMRFVFVRPTQIARPDLLTR
jgi:hypothetical protein